MAMEDINVPQVTDFGDTFSDSPRVEERLKICALHFLRGWSASKVWENYPEWEVSLTTVIHYFTEVRKRMKEQILLDEESIKLDLMAKYQYLYMKLIEVENYVEAKKVLDSVAKMSIALRHDITSNGQPIETIRLIEVKKEE